MSETVAIVVAAIVFLMIGIGLCMLAVFCYLLLKMMGQMQVAADKVLKAVTSAMGRVEQFNDARLVQAVQDLHRLVEGFPSILVGMKEFNRLWGTIGKTVLAGKAVVEEEPTPGAALAEDSAFYAYSEAGAASNEEAAEARRTKVVLTDEQMAGMRTA